MKIIEINIIAKEFYSILLHIIVDLLKKKEESTEVIFSTVFKKVDQSILFWALKWKIEGVPKTSQTWIHSEFASFVKQVKIEVS